MDRLTIKCLLSGLETETVLQLDKKAMPGEAGPCFMITDNGCFKGYIARQKQGDYKPIGALYYSTQDLHVIGESLQKQTSKN